MLDCYFRYGMKSIIDSFQSQIIQMGGKIMLRYIIIIALVLIILYDVNREDALGYIQSTLDFLQSLVYDMKESGKI